MHKEKSIGYLLSAASEALGAVSESPRLDAELLLARAIDVPRAYLFAHPEDELDEAAALRFGEALGRRLDGEPLAYISGRREFWSMPLIVSPATLVPRPETELLVDLALRDLPRRASTRVLDLGTGSGAIALAIAKERPLAEVVATDISADALAVARLNARELGIANVRFAEGDWTRAVDGERFGIIVCNPPYVPAGDPALAVLRYEPAGALVAGDDGLDAIRRLAIDCREAVAAGGRLLVEHGADQRDAVRALLEAAGWQDLTCHADFAGLPRVTAAIAPAKTPDLV